MKVLVGSENPVKLAAAKEAFALFYDDVEVSGMAVDSNVPAQPVGDETFAGAEHRAMELRTRNPDADFFVGIEGGIVRLFNRWFVSGVMCIMDACGRKGYGCTPLFELPSHITDKLLCGVELGDVIDDLAEDRNTKQKQGAIGYFTGGVMDRKKYYVDGLIAALIPFLNSDLYFESDVVR